MTMLREARGLNRHKWRDSATSNGRRVICSPATGLPSTYTSGLTVSANEVALIDKVVLSGISEDAAANTTITLKINGIELPFHFTGAVDVRHSKKYIWRTNGNLVLHPGQTLYAKATQTLYAASDATGTVAVYYRLYSLQKALDEGMFQGGSLPQVASTQTLTSGVLTAVTARKIVNGTFYRVPYDNEASGPFTVGETLTFSGGGTAQLTALLDEGTTGYIDFGMISGSVPANNETITGGTSSATADVNGTPSSYTKTIQILGFVWTGHNYAATQDSARIGFWDGSTGTFASNSNRFFKAYSMGADTRYATHILVGDTGGCIQATAGLGLYVDATTNLAGADSYRLLYDNEASGPFQVGETLTFSGGGTATLLRLTDAGTTGQLVIGPVTGAVPANNESITGGTSGATADVNGTPVLVTPGDFNVIYRYIGSSDTHNTTGAVGASVGGRRFWLYTETATTQTTGVSIPFFGANMPTVNIRILGQAASLTCKNETVAPSTVGLGIGNDSSLPITDLMVLNSDASGGAAQVSSSFFEDDMDLTVSTAFIPSYTGTMIAASGVDRSHLVWGEFGGGAQTGSAPANISRFS